MSNTENLPEVGFDDASARTYLSKRVVKQAVLVPAPSGLMTVIEAEWGEFQQFSGPWYAVYDPAGKVLYGVAQDEFESTHEPSEDGENTYVKVSPVEAYRYAGPPAAVRTRIVETTNTVRDGDYLVKWPGGEVGVLDEDNFRTRYEV